MARKNADRNRQSPSGQRSGTPASSGAGTQPGERVAGASSALSAGAIRSEEIRTGAQRETVEAFVVAFILALLFRAFIAEAFVIPTGSMAPTLMGAHKEIDCDECGQRFRIGASLEQRGPVTEQVVVGGVCPNCRHLNPLDLANESNDATFSGDRILVSKFAYTIRDPKRWDVIVFKFPGNPKQNYIKRLVGLPNETIGLLHGDVYAKQTGTDAVAKILRKPAETLLSMRHLVYDSDRQAKSLIEAGYPARLQPWQPGEESPPSDGWQVERNETGLTASLSGGSGGDAKWLRYYHRWPTDDQWSRADQGLSIRDVNPYESRAITDFYQYNSYAVVNANDVYNTKPSINGGMLGSSYAGGVFRPSYQSGEDLDQFQFMNLGGYDTGMDGLHWVGDLLFEADIETEADATQLVLELVESGVQHRCTVDLTSGSTVLSSEVDGQPTSMSGDGAPKAVTSLAAGARHTVRFSNCDDQLILWVDGDVVEFDRETTFDGNAFRSSDDNAPRFDGFGNPLDAAPVGIAVDGGATVHRVRVDRDKYYVATKDSSPGVYDYDLRQIPGARRGRLDEWGQLVQAQFAQPEKWDELELWKARRSVSFVMEADQFFPMGDNSPESLDARCWAGSKRFGQLPSVDENAYRFADAHYVPRELLVGKALAVFWPHPWNSPVPFTPNLKRMKFIR